MKLKNALIIILILINSSIYAQDLSEDMKTWYIGSVNLRLSKVDKLKVSHLTSLDLSDDYTIGFMQSGLAYQRRFAKFSLEGGYSFSTIRGSKSNTNYHRAHANISNQWEWGHLKMGNRIQIEKYFPTLQKFGARGVITNKISYYKKNWVVRPYIRNQVYYYQGGSPITYWILEDGEDNQEPTYTSEENSPDGWHRYRFTAGARIKLKTRLYLTAFFTRQIEFNTGWSPYTELNVYNQSQTRIKRPFNNYSLIGLSLSYTIKLY